MLFIGPRFIIDAHAQARAVYAWTVNDEQNMRWCIEHGLDGVITDDVTKFVGVREAWNKGRREVDVSWTSYVFAVWVWMLTMTIGWVKSIVYPVLLNTLTSWAVVQIPQGKKPGEEESECSAYHEMKRRHGWLSNRREL